MNIWLAKVKKQGFKFYHKVSCLIFKQCSCTVLCHDCLTTNLFICYINHNCLGLHITLKRTLWFKKAEALGQDSTETTSQFRPILHINIVADRVHF